MFHGSLQMGSENWEPPTIVAYVPQYSRYRNISQLYPHHCWLEPLYSVHGALVKSFLLMMMFVLNRRLFF